jgi:hypothetical protein
MLCWVASGRAAESLLVYMIKVDLVSLIEIAKIDCVEKTTHGFLAIITDLSFMNVLLRGLHLPVSNLIFLFIVSSQALVELLELIVRAEFQRIGR